MRWPLDPMTLMWIQVATGAVGMLALVHYWRVLMRKLGFVLDIKVLFSPKGGCLEAILAELKKARREVLVQAYSFTSDPLTNMLVELRKNGVDVQLILDKSNELERYSELHVFIEQGLNPLVDHEHAIAHNKIMVIDRRTVITGSFNFTNQAEHENAENLMIIRGHPDLVNWYRENFFKHKEHAKTPQIKEGQAPDRRGQVAHQQPKAA